MSMARTLANFSNGLRTSNRPMFSAQHTGGSVANGSAFLFSTININVDNCYNPTNGRFTAPIDGVYYFSFGTLSTNDANSVDFRFIKNGSITFGGAYTGAGVTAYKQGHGSAAIFLSAGDYVQCISFNTSYVHPDAPHNVFSGFLIG